jgi:flagellar secretion chaperone FliS
MIWHDAHDAYLESRVLSAGPIELVRILYQTTANAVREARRHLETGDVLARSRAISKASQALLELTGSLDFSSEGEIANRLAQLYSYMLCRLTDAHFQQTEAPLTEVLALLATLSEGWEAIGTTSPPPVEAANPWAHAAPQPETTVSGSAHAWSF